MSVKQFKSTEVPLSSLTPHPLNYRSHPEQQLQHIMSSILQHGFYRNVVVSKDNVILAGHGVVLAHEVVPVFRLDIQSDDPEAIKLLVGDNELSRMAKDDNHELCELLQSISNDGDDLGALVGTGFDEESLDDFLRNIIPAVAVEDDPVAVGEGTPITKRGDVWICGDHRIVCGDSTSPDDVKAVACKSDLIVTSPPYASQRDYTDASDVDDWYALMCGVFAVAPIHEHAQVLVNLGIVHRRNEWQDYWREWVEWMREKGWRRFGWYVWDQGNGLPGDWNGRLAPSHEFVFHFNRAAVKPNRSVLKNPANVKAKSKSDVGLRHRDGSVHRIDSPESCANVSKIRDSVIRECRQMGGIKGHPAPYSVKFAAALVESWRGTVYDPFLGSGTTMIACEQLDRTCHGLEIDPGYVDVAVRRWEKFTGKQAVLESDGKTFTDSH